MPEPARQSRLTEEQRGLAARHVPYALRLARRFCKTKRIWPSLHGTVDSAALLGLCQAASTYRASKGTFERHARKRIIGAILDEFREAARQRRSYAEKSPLYMETLNQRVALNDHAAEIERQDLVEAVLQGLGPQRASAVRLYSQGLTQGEVARRLGVAQSRAHHLIREGQEWARERATDMRERWARRAL